MCRRRRAREKGQRARPIESSVTSPEYGSTWKRVSDKTLASRGVNVEARRSVAQLDRTLCYVELRLATTPDSQIHVRVYLPSIFQILDYRMASLLPQDLLVQGAFWNGVRGSLRPWQLS